MVYSKYSFFVIFLESGLFGMLGIAVALWGVMIVSSDAECTVFLQNIAILRAFE
jgi:hypothetical protein